MPISRPGGATTSTRGSSSSSTSPWSRTRSARRRIAAARRCARFWKQAAWPGVEFNATLHKLIACGREALAHFTIRLVGAGRPTMSIEVHEIVRFADDGRIAELRAFWNESNLGVES